MKRYNIHLVASNKEATIKNLLEKINEFQGQKIEINISKWNYSFLALNYFLTNEMDEEPDIILIFDNAEFSKFDGATGKNIGYKKMLEAIRNAKINLQNSRIVVILYPEVKEDIELIKELVRLDIQNLHFVDLNNLDVSFLKNCLFGYEKTYEDNIEYLKYADEKEIEPIIKYVDRVVEKQIVETEVVEKIIEKTKTIEKIIEIETEKPDTFKKLILTIWDNAEFGCELAYIAAKLSKLEVLLVDADTLSPKADLILNIPKQPGNIKTEGLFSDSGFNIIMDTIEKDIFNPTFFSESIISRKELKNLHILTGNYRLENYEYYTKESYITFLEKCYHAFDLVIVLVNRSIYDLFTLISLSKSDYNLVAIKPDLLSLRDYNMHINFLHEKQQIDGNKFKFIGYENVDGLGIKDSILKEVTENNFLGYIGYAKKRELYRSLKIPFIRKMTTKQIDEYKEILAYFKIIPKRKLIDKIRSNNKIFKLRITSFIKKVNRKLRIKRR